MSDDLIKNEAEFIRNCATDIETGEPLDDDQMCNMYVIDAHRIADLIDAVEERIEELERERDGYLAERNKFELYLQRTHADLELEAAAVEALTAKLAKAIEALREIEADCEADYPPSHGAIKFGIRATLAKLDGKE
jgi:molecular chaperone GrpE (heat shock protein)